MAFKGRVNKKARNDRNHAIYKVIAPDGSAYIGITFVRPPTAKKHSRSKMPMISVMSRFKSHCYRANNGSTDFFHTQLLALGQNNFRVEILEVVRGKKAAHKRERELIELHKPNLNTH